MPETKKGFTKYSIDEFENWMANVTVNRTIRLVQQHHTFLPNYDTFARHDHFTIQSGMKSHHVGNNGWSDIGQHFSIFPDGAILTGRPLNKNPACIFGANSGAICFEHVGDFDAGKDQMRDEQRDAILRATAAVLRRFTPIPRNDKGVVYHHWYDLSTGARRDGQGTTKSCPGTAFFGGNNVADFNANFLPPLLALLGATPAAPAPAPAAAPPHVAAPGAFAHVRKFVAVSADFLNIRTGPGTNNPKISEHGPAILGTVLRVFDDDSRWLKISNSKDQWVYGRYTYDVTEGVVTTDDSNVREGPGMAFSPMETLDTGDRVFIHETDGNWVRIGADRWIHNSLVA